MSDSSYKMAQAAGAFGVADELAIAKARIEELERELTEWTAMAGEQRHRAEELEREVERLKDENKSIEGEGGWEDLYRTAFDRAEAAEAMAERERARADDHDSARQSEKERADYADARTLDQHRIVQDQGRELRALEAKVKELEARIGEK